MGRAMHYTPSHHSTYMEVGKNGNARIIIATTLRYNRVELLRRRARRVPHSRGAAYIAREYSIFTQLAINLW